MDKNKKYPSKYSNGKFVSSAQYITELICEKKAKLNGQDLHFRFWTNKLWSSFYRNQIGSANKLLKKYSDVAIIKALNSAEASKIYSLRAPHLIAIIEQHQQILESSNKVLKIQLDRTENKTYKTSDNNTKNIISKLKDLDHGS
jgi:hypothetical protein